MIKIKVLTVMKKIWKKTQDNDNLQRQGDLLK